MVIVTRFCALLSAVRAFTFRMPFASKSNETVTVAVVPSILFNGSVARTLLFDTRDLSPSEMVTMACPSTTGTTIVYKKP